MAEDWEVRGLFGNEYALENAIEELNSLAKVPVFKVLDRRNLQVLLSKGDRKGRELVKNVIKITHGFVEADSPLGEYDTKRAAAKRKKLKDAEEKRKRAAKSKH